MKFLLALLLLLPGTAGAAGRVSAPLGGGSFTNGQAIVTASEYTGYMESTGNAKVAGWLLVQGASVNALGSLVVGSSITAQSLTLTGTAPSLTATGAVFKGTVSVNGTGAEMFIGPTTPAALADFNSDAANTLHILNPNSVASVDKGYQLPLFYTGALSADQGGSIGFGGTYSGSGSLATWAGIKGMKSNATDSNLDGYMSFLVRDNAGGINVERMRLIAGGNLGIGTASPSAKLHVVGDGFVKGGTVTIWNPAGTDAQLRLKGYESTGGASEDSGELRIGGGATASYGARIGFNGVAGANTLITNMPDNAVTGIILAVRGSGTRIDAMKVNGDGNVGVGTLTPASKLHVSGGSVLVSTGALVVEGSAARPLEVGAQRSDGTLSTFTITSNGVMFLNAYNSAIALPTVPGMWVMDMNGVAAPIIGFHQSTQYRRGMRNPAGNRDVDIFTENNDGDGNVNIYTGNNTLTASFRDTGGFRSYSRTIAQLLAITPEAVGEQFFCSNCSPAKLVVSTGTSAGNFADAIGGAFQ